jgi:hypothetical protein
MTATRRPIIRPDGFDRSSGTSKIPHRADAVAVTGAWLWIVQSIIGRPARTRAEAVVVTTADVDGALATGGVGETTELVGAAPGSGGSDEPHPASNPMHRIPATARLALPIRSLLGFTPRHSGIRHDRAHRSAAAAGPNVTIGEPA